MLPSLSDDEIEDRYFLIGRMEILSVLNELILRREPVTVYFRSGRDFFQTTLLEARADALVFDLSGDPEINKRLPISVSCIFVSNLNGIRVQFACGQAERFEWGGSDAFSVPLPDRIVRVQRRESYRILLPVAKPLMVKLFDDDDRVLGEWPAHDLSVGGLGFSTVGEPPLQIEQHIARLHLPLPGQVDVQSAAQIRHVTPMVERPDGVRFRVGVSFADLAPATGVAIQRFITKIEHQRRGQDNGRRLR
ncbi:c-di-GMP-binding flagellar brake protein YcgR [Paucimonas lemoignei]|uniref:Flagellar brake protein YcgR n=1 Tax=Paucimonas lemoignei TaxID=29443 RepID=A0A4R3HZX7_PAULE|nr:flagellar brake protein [Paucimonas lemoignei]TCS37845.1 c-di-GMP-binding flagellar brake protein YcgR [Paucimonas lemoignei]